jgi:twitching motility protein PilT
MALEPSVHLVDSLLAAIVREDGESLVLHVGERPVVVSSRGPSEIASSAMTLEAMDGRLAELLRPEARQALTEFGAVEAEVAPSSLVADEHFTVVAAQGGDDIWIEIRRRRPTASTTPQRPSEARMPAGRNSDDRTPPVESAVVLPLSRNPARGDVPARPAARLPGLDRLLKLAAARGAEALYLFSQSRPSIRVDGEIHALDEPVLTPQDVDGLMLEVVPERPDDGLPSGSEWICDVKDVGRVRCLSFRDHRGPGGIFRMIPARAASADQLGLSREIQALCGEPEGLILVTGPRASGKSTLLAAFVDLINRTRGDYVITLETRVKVLHDSRSGLVSQREVRGSPDELLATLRGALRESPDVLVIEELRSQEVAAEAIEAAGSGHLVICGLPAHSAPEAIERLLDLCPPERRVQLQALVAETLRGVVAQVLLRKSGGGRVAARELLLGTPSVAGLIAEGKLAQLTLALDNGRRHGMVPLTDALVAFVQSGVVDVKEAWRRASDRASLLKQLKREGIDTSFTERLA